MTRSTVETLATACADSASLIFKLIDECPDNLWSEKAGNWPIWQHVAHSASATDFFLPGDSVPLPQGLTPDVAGLKVVGTEPVAKAALKDYYKGAQAKIDAFLAGLSDDDLPKENQKLKGIGLNWTIAKTVTLLCGHPLYHLGNADAVLRSHGHKGIF
ncbi:MAG: DinB family protein [Deltaproteobacteria bacterium]|jgi:uncharacterized damage-inducible protein DinB|nr:DinB family protein [Deltaproteobacteria bacterium]